METLHSIMTVVSPGQWMASLDLKDVYFHVPIQAEHHKFLRFHWLGQTYQFQALPFSLSSAPQVSMKVLAPVMAWLRRQGIQIFAYLDDIPIVGFTHQEVESAVWTALQTLMRAGYIINLKKSDLRPVQDLVYIGGQFQTNLAQIFLISCVRSFCQVCPSKLVHQLFRLLGLMAVTLLVIPYAHLSMRPVQWYLKTWWMSSPGLNHLVFVNSNLVWNLQWWTVDSNLLEGKPFMFPPHTVTVTMDASMVCWGGHAQGWGLHSTHFHGMWDQKETSLHINVLELRVVRLMLCSLGEALLGQVIWIESDNSKTVAYINTEGGVLSPAFNCETMHLYKWLVPRNIQLQAVHRPRVDNILADYLSHHVVDPIEMSLDGKLPRHLFKMWGRPQIDLFALASNTHLPLWYSCDYHPEAIAPNALLQQWTGLSLYVFPQFPLLARTLAKIWVDGV